MSISDYDIGRIIATARYGLCVRGDDQPTNPLNICLKAGLDLATFSQGYGETLARLDKKPFINCTIKLLNSCNSVDTSEGDVNGRAIIKKSRLGESFIITIRKKEKHTREPAYIYHYLMACLDQFNSLTAKSEINGQVDNAIEFKRILISTNSGYISIPVCPTLVKSKNTQATSFQYGPALFTQQGCRKRPLAHSSSDQPTSDTNINNKRQHIDEQVEQHNSSMDDFEKQWQEIKKIYFASTQENFFVTTEVEQANSFINYESTTSDDIPPSDDSLTSADTPERENNNTTNLRY